MITDGLTSLATGIGTDRSASYTASYSAPTVNDQQYINAYRTSPLARIVVERPAKDAFRKWREWQAEAEQISAIEKVEKDHDIRGKLERAKILANLLGSAYVYISLGDNDPSEPVNLNRVGLDGIQDVLVLSKTEVIPGVIDNNALSPNYGMPMYYEVTGATELVRIHPSRMVIFYGKRREYEVLSGRDGDSVLLSVLPYVQRHEMMTVAVNDLMQEACVDVVTVPGLSRALQDPAQERALIQRFATMKQMKSNNRVSLLDGSDTPDINGEQWDQKKVTFSTIPDVVKMDQEELSAVCEMPRALLFGVSSGGLGSTGELELSSHYDRIQSVQVNEIQPAISILDECIIRSALGSRPDDVWYKWASLWQTSDKDLADIGVKVSDMWSKFVNSGIIPADAATLAAINSLTELGIGGGIEQTYDEWLASGGEGDEEDMTDEVETATS